MDSSCITEIHSDLRRSKINPSGNIRGYFSEMAIGLFKRTDCIVFVYLEEQSMKLAILGNVYNLSAPNMKALVKGIFPFINRFILLKSNEVILAFNYWFFEKNDYWPERDIFPFIERITYDSKSKARTMLIFDELAKGGDVTRRDFLERLEKEK